MKAVLACALLAGVDTVGTYFAVRAVRGGWPFWLAGAACFVLLFAVFVSVLGYANLTGVTLGWIVLVQLAAIVIDTRVVGTQLNAGVYVGCGLALAGLSLAMVSATGLST